MELSENPYDSKLTKGAPIPVGGRRVSWLASVIFSGAVVYGPYVIMVIYTQIYVACDHCKQATRNLLVCAPGLLPMELAQRGLAITRQADWIWFGVATLFALAWVVGLACLLRRSLWIGVPAVVLTLATCSWMAVVVLAMIRM